MGECWHNYIYIDQYVNRVPYFLKTLQLIVDCHCGCKTKGNVLLERAVHRCYQAWACKDASWVILRVLAYYGYGQLISKLDVVWLTVIYSNLWNRQYKNLIAVMVYINHLMLFFLCPVQGDSCRLAGGPVGTSFDLNKHKIKYCLC